MKRNRTYNYILPLAVFAMVLSSCIRDKIQPCPPLQVKIDIQDKNYSNIDFIEENTGLAHRIDENLNFSDYIQKLFYALYDLETGKLVAVQHLHEVTGNARMATVYLPENLPFGRYRLIVWGNIDSEKGILSDGRYDTYDLHTGSIEGYDVYMTADELVYDEWNYDYTVKLKRLKGKLIIMAENFPDEIEWSRKTVSNVMGNVDYNLQYSESEDVITELSWEQTAKIVSNTFISPSATSSGSTVTAKLYDNPEMENAAINLSPVSVNFNRNEITVLRYTYKPETGTTEVFILLDNGWNEIVNLEK